MLLELFSFVDFNNAIAFVYAYIQCLERPVNWFSLTFCILMQVFLAHLSQRLIGELIGYPWSGVRPSSSVVNNFKRLLLQNRLADQSQILCGASLGRGTIFCSRHLGHMTKMAAMPIYGKNPSKIFFSRTGGPISRKLGM